jgi:hypothetical protein
VEGPGARVSFIFGVSRRFLVIKVIEGRCSYALRTTLLLRPPVLSIPT